MNRKRLSKNVCIVTALVALLSACAPVTRVTLLPQPNGAPSAVELTTTRFTQRITEPYQVAQVYASGVLGLDTTTDDKVRQAYPELFALQPPAPELFTLQFEAGSTQLTTPSQAQLDTVIARARARAGGEILITGHADRQGSADANFRLSLQRAQAVRALLIERGFAADLTQALGHGEHAPVVPTEDDVAEPRNRRVELIVR